MKVNNEFVVGVPVEEAGKALLDLQRITPCLPGASIERPVLVRQTTDLAMSAHQLGRERQYLAAAGRAVEHPIGQASHLGVSALLAGVAAQGVRQGGYLAERSQHRFAQGAAAEITARRVAIDELEITCFAEWTDQRARLRG